MIVITQDASTPYGWAEVRFPYDPALVAMIREIPGRRWDADAKAWLIHAAAISSCATMFQIAGQVVMVNGVEWTGSVPPREKPQASGDAPFGKLFAYLPAELRKPVYSALAKVLHPDMGGTKEIMQELNKHKP